MAYLFALSRNLPSVEQLDSRQVSQSTKIYDREGKTLLYEISGGQKRTVIPIEEMPQFLKDAVITVEDEKFYSEPGVDWRAIIRAFVANALSGRIVQGASTISQQLARNAFLAPDQTVARKLKEFMLAIQLNRHYSKDQILALYLNEIPFGPTLYGVEAASRGYFGKSAKDLSLAEAAILAGLPKAPSYYSPWGSHQKELIARQQFILKKMLSVGKIDKEQFDAAMRYPIVFEPQSDGIRAPHFVIAVEDYLVKKYGEDLIRSGGLIVKTTLDWNMQQIAEKAVREGADRNAELYKGKNAALVAEDANTGQILALVGSRDYFDTQNEGNFNVATQGLRQPGSALKPFAYLTAFRKGYAPETVVFDAPTEFSKNQNCPLLPDYNNTNFQCFHPQNFDERFRGPVAFRTALAQSVNVPAVKVLYLAGLADTVDTLRNFGITTLDNPSRYGLSLVLGGGAVKLIDLVHGYSVLAEDGVKHGQTMILEVRRNGAVLESYVDASERMEDPQYIRMVNDILSDADARAPLMQASLPLTVFPDRDVALKTGTSNDYHDAWAMGYTPSFVVGVWAGNNNNAPMVKHGSSILAAVPIWHAFMAEALKTQPSETFARPDPVNPEKPILRGDYAANQEIHSILYYVDRSDPNGPPPSNPGDDPQFENWEAGVLAWARNNIPNFGNFNTGNGSAGAGEIALSGPISVKIESPQAGAFMGQSIPIAADLRAGTEITLIRVYFNSQLVQQVGGIFPKDYRFIWTLAPQTENAQNLLEIEAVDKNGLAGRDRVIVYR